MTFEDRFNLGQDMLDIRSEFQQMGRDWLVQILEEFLKEHPELETVPRYIEVKLDALMVDFMERVAEIWGTKDFRIRFDALVHDFMDEYRRRT